MRRRWWSHLVALLCIVYLVALLVFHQHLDPFTANDTPDAAAAAADQASSLRLLGNFSNNPQLQAPRTLKLQLQQLEAGMTQLEQEISHVKSKLTVHMEVHTQTSLPRHILQPPELHSQPKHDNNNNNNNNKLPQLVEVHSARDSDARIRDYRPKGDKTSFRDLLPEGGQGSDLHAAEADRPGDDRGLRGGDSLVFHRPEDGARISLHQDSQAGKDSRYDQPQTEDMSSDPQSQDDGDSSHRESGKEGAPVNHHLTDAEILNRLYQQTQRFKNSNRQNERDGRVPNVGRYHQDGGKPRSQGQASLSDQPGYEQEGLLSQRGRLARKQERFYHQPLSKFPDARSDSMILPGDHMGDVQGMNEDASVEEDFANSSLVKVGEGVAVYAAYHDDREPSKPTVRLIIILSAPKPKRGVLCHFLINSNKPVTTTVQADQYELCENHKKKYLGFIYSCPVPGAVPSSRYQLSLSAAEEAETRVPVPVIDVSPPEIREGKATEESHGPRYNFSVCVSPLFGSVLAKRLVEFLELTHMLGFQHIFFYDFQLSSVIQRVLDYYQKRGYVTVLPWKLPASMSSTRIWYHGQLVTNNDCLYRTMPLSAYTAFHDIDEFIVPHHPAIRSLGELLPRVLANDTCGYSFQSAFYDPGIATSDFPDDLMTVALTARPAMLSKIRTKVLVAPRRVFEVGIHHISKQFREHWAPRRYDSSRAILHHYRQCIHDYGMRCENWTKDTIIRDRYFPELKTRMQEVIRTLRL